MLKRNFTVSEPNTVWVLNITYIWTFKGFVYLTSVMKNHRLETKK